MKTSIKCPHCQELIEVTELLKKIDEKQKREWGKAGALKRWGV